MAIKRKPTLKQLFKAWLKCEQKSKEAQRLQWNLDELANQTSPGTELIVHNDIVYRVTTRDTYAGRINYEVKRIAQSEELEKIK